MTHTKRDKWTHWDLNPGPSACGADVIPLHHVPVRGRPPGYTHLGMPTVCGTYLRARSCAPRCCGTCVMVCRAAVCAVWPSALWWGWGARPETARVPALHRTEPQRSRACAGQAHGRRAVTPPPQRMAAVAAVAVAMVVVAGKAHPPPPLLRLNGVPRVVGPAPFPPPSPVPSPHAPHRHRPADRACARSFRPRTHKVWQDGHTGI